MADPKKTPLSVPIVVETHRHKKLEVKVSEHVTIRSWKENRTFVAALPLVVGILAFFLVAGPRVLSPTNIAWLARGDSAQHYLGWLFFRNSAWSFPVGLNPSYGLEIGNAIVYSDSLPLLALPFKLVAPVLPEPFQYFGIWILACFALQAWFGWKLVGLISESVAIRLLGVGFLVLSPPMIWRMHEKIGHHSLVGHFLVLAALYLTLRPKSQARVLAWGSLLVIAALVHAYLLAMVALLWITDVAGRSLSGELSLRNTVVEAISIGAATSLICWQAGYFSVGRGLMARGYGFYRMNLLSIFDAGKTDYGLWSHILGDIPGDEAHHEGFNFLGLGAIALMPFAARALIGKRKEAWAIARKRSALLLLFLGLTLFAVSNNIGIGRYNFGFPLSAPLLQISSLFRSSGRMFWPVAYGILLVLIFLVVRGYKQRTAVSILGSALLIQLVDTSAGWAVIRRQLMTEPASTWSTPLVDPFWAQAATRYKRVRWIPPGGVGQRWEVLATYAGTHGLSTDAVYLARTGWAEMEQAQRKASEALRAGKYEGDSLYVLSDRALQQAVGSADAEADLLAKIDGFNVLAPGWKRCTDCRQMGTQ